MRRDTIERAPGSACAPGSGRNDPGPGKRGPRRDGISMPPRGLIALIALGLIGLISYRCDDLDPESSRMRLIPGAPGGQTIDFALSPDGKWVAMTSSDGWASLRSLGDDQASSVAFSPD